MPVPSVDIRPLREEDEALLFGLASLDRGADERTLGVLERETVFVAEVEGAPAGYVALEQTEAAVRVDQLVPYGYTDTAIATFHAFGDRLIREHALATLTSPRSRNVRPGTISHPPPRELQPPLSRGLHSGLLAALVVGPRTGHGRIPMPP